MIRGKQCPARATVFIYGEKAHARCMHEADFHIDQEAANRPPYEVIVLPHRIRFADGQIVTWERDGQLVWP